MAFDKLFDNFFCLHLLFFNRSIKIAKLPGIHIANLTCSSTVPESCYRYTSQHGYSDVDAASGGPDTTCLIPRSHHFNVVKALGNCPELLERKGLFKTQPPYRVGRRNTSQRPKRREQDIQFEIMTHGPVQGRFFF